MVAVTLAGVRLAALRAFPNSSLAEDAETRHAEQRHRASTVVRCGLSSEQPCTEVLALSRRSVYRELLRLTALLGAVKRRR